jgi:endo-1,4-beta-xylanase
MDSIAFCRIFRIDILNAGFIGTGQNYLCWSNLYLADVDLFMLAICTTIAYKDAFKGNFYIGVALSREQFLAFNTKAEEIAKIHFNAIVAENCMKSMYLQPEEGAFFFGDADKFVEYGEKNNMYITGHTLIWHSQTPHWFFKDGKGNDVSLEVLIERMKRHIYTVVGRYRGKIKGWDVVNEAILDNGEKLFFICKYND